MLVLPKKIRRQLFAGLALFLLLARPAPGFGQERCSDDTVCVEGVGEQGVINLYARNLKAYPISVRISASLQNMRPSTRLPASFVLNGHDRIRLFTLTRINPEQAWGYDYRLSWSAGGRPASSRSTDHLYRLPYAVGARHKVSQSCNGRETHTGRSSEAVDLYMSEGTPVHAAREGVVYEVKGDSRKGGRSPEYEKEANYIVIAHPDGTFGEYFHLMPDGVGVRVGQRVARGEVIGRSGRTGYASGAHLHFAVTVAAGGGDRVSVPFRFATAAGEVACPEKGRYLEAID